MEYLKMYIIAFVFFIAIDALWLGLVAPKFYKAQIGHLMAEKPNLIAALVFYLIFVVGIVYFVVNPAIESQSMTKLLVSGILFGFITYATYDLTNFHEFKAGTVVNIEFDIIGKYVARIVRQQLNK